MSESYDDDPPFSPRSEAGPATQLVGHPPPPPGAAPPRIDLKVATRRTQPEQSSATAPIVPAGSVTGNSLTLVITIMCFLACLTAGSVYMINQSAAAWMRNIASEVTVLLEPGDPAAIETTLARLTESLQSHPGISSARALSVEESSELLEPWLGQSDVIKTLPIPRLVALTLDRDQPPDLGELRESLAKEFPTASLDDHRQWQLQIRTVTRSMAVGGLVILLLVGAATTAVIISATRSAMASNRDIVEVLHFVGATDSFIAREFQRHFLALGIRAGLVGAASATVVFVLMPTVMPLLGGGPVTAAELRNLVGVGTLDLPGFSLMGGLVIVIAALCMLTSRYGVFRILNARD